MGKLAAKEGELITMNLEKLKSTAEEAEEVIELESKTQIPPKPERLCFGEGFLWIRTNKSPNFAAPSLNNNENGYFGCH